MMTQATCETHGHIYRSDRMCIMCGQPVPKIQIPGAGGPSALTAAIARLSAWVRSEAEGADLPEHYPQTHRGMMDVERLVAAVEQAQSMLRRAMDHGLNGSAYYHAMKAGDLGDEVKAYLENAGAR